MKDALHASVDDEEHTSSKYRHDDMSCGLTEQVLGWVHIP